jgi:hypothetical protein
MRRSIILLAALSLPLLAFGKKKDAAPAAPAKAPLKAGINQKCLQSKADEGKDASAFMSLGELDQVRGDLKGAFDKYKKAFSLDADVANHPIDFTMVGEVIWIQNANCPVPVPSADVQAASAPDTLAAPKIDYPMAINREVRAEGNVTPRVWIGADGKAARVAIVDVTAGPPGYDHPRDPGQEAAERFLARVQFSLSTLDAFRGYDMGADNAGKVWEKKIAFVPPNEMESNLPGSGPNTSISSPDTNVLSPKR